MLISCGGLSEDTTDTTITSGNLDSITAQYNYLKSSVVPLIIAGIDTTIGQASGFTASYDVNQYNITYTTTDANGNSTLASAAVFVPSTNTNVNTLLYLHGSTSIDNDRPTYASISYNTTNPALTTHTVEGENAFAIALASEGKIVIMPDYLGFGASSELHPYIHAGTLASASIDAVLATQALENSSVTEFTMSDKLIITGYSEGGYATMATHKELVNNSSSYPTIVNKIVGVIPGSPPCDLSVSMANTMLNSTNYPTPAFLPFLLYAYNNAYSITTNVTSFVKPEYASAFTDLDTKTKSLGDISADLPSTPNLMIADNFKAEITAALADYSTDRVLDTATASGFYEKLNDNDVYNYNPGPLLPYYILHLNADNTVPIENSEVAVHHMTTIGTATSAAIGGNIALIDPSVGMATAYTAGTLTDHSAGFVFYILTTKGIANTIFQ